MIKYTIETLLNYPDNEKHQQCFIDLPFQIRKGEDGYFWHDKKGKEHKYNWFKSEKIIDKRWIVHLNGDTNQSLEEIFNIKVSKNLNAILDYCTKLYKKSLEMEMKRLEQMIK